MSIQAGGAPMIDADGGGAGVGNNMRAIYAIDWNGGQTIGRNENADHLEKMK